jgi:hypothetical protein
MKAFGVHGPGIALALVLALLLAGSIAYAQQGDYSLSWVTVAGGGESRGGAYTMVAAAAQPEVSAEASGGDYTMVGGVWGSPIVPRYTYLPLVLKG